MPTIEQEYKPIRLSRPSVHAVKLARKVIERNESPVIAEIGIGYGATSIEICRLLKNRGALYLFDFEDKTASVSEMLERFGFHNVVCNGNSRKLFDSYAWSLAQLLLRRRKSGDLELFDFVYLDGEHCFHHDTPAALVLKELLKTGGYILFDDYDWSFETSQTLNPNVNPLILGHYTDEQIRVPHVRLICDLFFDSDPSFSRVDIGYGSREHRRAYRKVGR